MRSIPAALCAIAAAAPCAQAAILGANHDNTLYQDATGSTSNGAGPGFFAGLNASSSIRRGLISFDLTGIPAGSTITAVSLSLHQSGSQTAPVNVSLNVALASWGEGTSNASVNGGSGAPSTTNDAPGLHRFYNTTFWSAPGGDMSPTASATTSIAGVNFYSWSSPGLIADVQTWVNNPAANFGWFVLGDETAAGAAKRFDSRENTTASFQPALTVTYTPTPSTATLLALAALRAARRRR